MRPTRTRTCTLIPVFNTSTHPTLQRWPDIWDDPALEPEAARRNSVCLSRDPLPGQQRQQQEMGQQGQEQEQQEQEQEEEREEDDEQEHQKEAGGG